MSLRPSEQTDSSETVLEINTTCWEYKGLRVRVDFLQ